MGINADPHQTGWDLRTVGPTVAVDPTCSFASAVVRASDWMNANDAAVRHSSKKSFRVMGLLR
jgi:hypothetical protein